MRRFWGDAMAMVFQDPMTSLNPVMKIGKQITEAIHTHLDVTKQFADELAVSLLESVRVPDPERRMGEYPHQLSGGLRQRICIAIALACGPQLLLADEPTTALDVTVQAQVLDVLAQQQRERFMAVILVTHDLGVVAGRADDVLVMYAGQVVEKAPTATLFRHMKMPYTEALLRSIPKLGDRATRASPRSPVGRPTSCRRPPAAASRRAARTRRTSAARRCRRSWTPTPPVTSSAAGSRSDRGRSRRARPVKASAAPTPAGPLMAGTGTAHLRPDGEALLRVEDLVVEFSAEGGKVQAVSGISLDVVEGETLGLVGESGCGKSTTGRAIMQIIKPSSGSVRFEDDELTARLGRGCAARARGCR